MLREPESWRALPRAVRRRVLRDARRGVAPEDPAVAAAAREWAERTEPVAGRLLVVYPVVAAVLGAVAALTGWPVLAFAASYLVVTTLAAWVGRGQARQVLGALDRRPPAA